MNLLTIWFLPFLVRMTLKAIHRILWTWRRVTETLDVHWMYTALYAGHTLDCVLDTNWRIYFAVHWTYTGHTLHCALYIGLCTDHTVECTWHCTLGCTLGVHWCVLGCTVFCTLYIDLCTGQTLGCTLDCALGLYTRCELDCTPDVHTCIPDVH